MIHTITTINDPAPLDIYADIIVTCDTGTLEIKGDGKSVIAHTSSLRVVLTLLKMFKRIDAFAQFLRAADSKLKQMGVTLFWRSSRFGVLGSEGKPILLSMLTWLCRPSKR